MLEVLECLASIVQAKQHPKELPASERCDNGCFWDVTGVQGDLMVSSNGVHFGEDAGTSQLGSETFKIGYGVLVEH